MPGVMSARRGVMSEPLPLDPFEAAALRQRQSVRPDGGRTEGKATELLGIMGQLPMNMAGNLKNLMDAAYSHEMGTSVRDNPQYGGLAADAALNVVGLPALTGGVPAGALGSAAKGIRAYHGSPHDFDRFDLSKIGTGEGAQAYGHGLYFAENEGVAGQYKANLSKAPRVYGKPVAEYSGAPEGFLYRAGGDVDRAMAEAQSTLRELEKSTVKADEFRADGARKALAKLHQWKYDNAVQPPGGRMYEVNINARPEQFLDWDKPLSQMGDPVREKLAKAWLAHPEAHAHQTGGQIYEASRIVPGDYRDPAAATKTLQAAGIPGIKYLDQLSRPGPGGMTSAGMRLDVPPKTHNYVVFDDKLIDILRKYGIMGASAIPGAGIMGSQLEPAQ